MLAHGAWVLVADGEKALFLENKGDPDLPDLRIIGAEERTLEPNRETYSDDEGRRMDNHALGQRSAMERTDYKQIDKARFAEEIVRALEIAHRDKRFQALAIFAPSKVLGSLRHAMSKELAQAVVVEQDKNFTNEPAETLEKRVLEAL